MVLTPLVPGACLEHRSSSETLVQQPPPRQNSTDSTSTAVGSDIESPATKADSAAFFEVEPTYPDRVQLSVELQTTYRIVPQLLNPSDYVKPASNCTAGWTRYVHPSGRAYHYNHELCTVVPGNGPIDWVDWSFGGMNENGVLAMQTIHALWAELRKSISSSQCELFFKAPDEVNAKARYYFVHWTYRLVFWVEPVDMPLGITSIPHQRDVLTSLFWAHVDHFPVHRTLPLRAREELEAMLSFQAVDEKTHRESTSLWDATETQMLCKCIRASADSVQAARPHPAGRRWSVDGNLKADTAVDTAFRSDEETGARNAAVARLWRQICVARVINLYGDAQARVGRTESRPSVEPSLDRFAWLRTVVSLMLFNRPTYFHKQLQDVFVDEVLYTRQWENFVEREVQPEWKDNGVVAAVILAANMAFLALNGIQGPDDKVALDWKMLSLSSTLFSMGTILASLMLVQSYQSLKSLSAKDANEYMMRCSLSPLGLYGMAVLFSMPFVMLILSLVAFVVAVLGYSFQHWSTRTALPLLLSTVVPLVVVIVWQSLFLGRGEWTWLSSMRSQWQKPFTGGFCWSPRRSRSQNEDDVEACRDKLCDP